MAEFEQSPADVLVEYLVTATSVVTLPTLRLDWPVFVGSLPNDPDNAVSVRDGGGSMDGRSHKTGDVFEHPGIQITVRGKEQQVSWSKANELAGALKLIRGQSVVFNGNTYRLLNAMKTTPVLYLGEEETKRRVSFGLNYNLTIRMES